MTRASFALLAAVGCTDSTTPASDSDPGSDTSPDVDTMVETADTGAPKPPDCPDGRCIVEGVITEDTTFFGDLEYLLRGVVVVGNDADPVTLTIRAGATVLGEVKTTGTLVISRHADIVADGTAKAPVVFTSSAPPGARARGDWGGLVINGRAPVNQGVEGVGAAGTGSYGGTASDDSSGSLRFVRIEFAGAELATDQSIAGLQLAGVGDQTTIEHVQVHRAGSDGIGVFGGTVNLRRVVVSQSDDDGIDWSEGWTGRGQWVVVQSPQGEDAGGNGIEGGNLSIAPDAEPISDPILANVTLIGNDEGSAGLFLRQGTRGQVWNVLASGYARACIDVDDEETWGHLVAGEIDVRNARFACPALAIVDDEDLTDDGTFNLADPLDFVAWLTEPPRGNADLEMPGWTGSPTSPTAPSFGSTETTKQAGPDDAFFEGNDIVGAVGDEDWTSDWTAYPAD